MVTGLCFILFGLLILFYPQLLIGAIAGFLILFGLGMMATSWQFRRLHKRSESQFVNWIIKY